MISTLVHGIIDYLFSILLIASPWLFHFNQIGYQTYVVDTIASIIATYSMFTKYELSISKNISMRTHLWMDIFLSAFLAASPWIFAFADKVYLPHLIMGIAGIVISVLTKRKSPLELPLAERTDKDHVLVTK